MTGHQPRTMAMDPPHITEFASERYFEKLNQLNAQQQQQQHHQPPPSPDTFDATQSPSRFILPVRDSKIDNVEPIKPNEKRDKSRFFGLRSKVSILHSKQSPGSSAFLGSRPSAESTRKSAGFDELFLGLPNELQMQIISSLPLTDILNLRLASKSWHALVTLNENTIARYHLEHHIPAYASRLYPVTDPRQINFQHLCGLWHRLHVAAKLAFLMCEWITKDIFLRQTEAQRNAFAPQNECMRRRLIPLLFTIFHFFETYRKLYLQRMTENDGKGLRKEPYTLNPIEAEIMNMYDDRTLLRVHEVFPLVISSFCRRLRPPTYVGRVERSLRGYIREKPSDDVHVAILCIGGLRQVERLWEIKGYNSRRGAVDTWFNSLTKEAYPTELPASKPKRGLFGRKKSTSEARSSENALNKVRSSGSIDGNMDWDANLVFNSSLSAGAPMSPLSSQQAQTLLSDLPVLQQIWLTTAEALVLQRRIVERPQDIKRNQQVMLDLIREDGIDEEDEWWYGRSIPDSVRPPVSGTDDDAD
ncbi:cyclin-like f-box [Fusarium heterosporum]|uniref:Cyclin-like f-box n=1 Tax=Fusarium heterosporum TaxID=42747 RepID=A0A8H5T485_FUSHE|nr:cyclin-like f-box [Fusarium heterosporum]